MTTLISDILSEILFYMMKVPIFNRKLSSDSLFSLFGFVIDIIELHIIPP